MNTSTVKAVWQRYKTPALVILAVVGFGVSFVAGRNSTAGHEIEKIVEVEKIVTRTEIKVVEVEKKVLVEVEARDVRRQTTTVVKPDGSTTTVEIVEDKTKTKTKTDSKSETELQVASSAETTQERVRVVEVEKIVSVVPNWHLGLRLGGGAQLAPLTPVLSAGASVERRIFGPLFVGVYADVQMTTAGTPLGFQAGASLSAAF